VRGERQGSPDVGVGRARRATTRAPARRLRAAALLLALVGAACEYPGVPHPLAAAEELPPAAQAPAIAAPTSLAPGSLVPAPAAAPTPLPPAEVRVGLKDFELDPNEIAARSGGLTFVLVNEGRFTHDFHVEGNGVDDHSGRIGAGRTSEWKITLVPGTYKVSCLVSNHAERGMTGTLVVTGP